MRAHRAALARGERLEALTVGWDGIEAAVAIGVGVAARSVLLRAMWETNLAARASAAARGEAHRHP